MAIKPRIWLPDLEIMDLMSFQTHKILSKLEGEILTRKGLKTLFSTSVTGKSFVSRRVEIRLIIITLPVIYSTFPVSSDDINFNKVDIRAHIHVKYYKTIG